MSNILIGQTIVGVDLATDKKALRFRFDGADPVVVKVDGDCCSETWIESLDAPEALIGTVVEAVDLPLVGEEREEDFGDVVLFYGFRITTERGVCVIDYRNASNGYYGGNLSWPDDSYYYGGVYGQNKSEMEWERIAGVAA